MQRNCVKGRKIWYQCRICRILVGKKYAIAQHITEKHVHDEESSTPERDDAKPAVLNPILKWRSNPTKETAPWEEVQLPEIILLLTDCRQSSQNSRHSKRNFAKVGSPTSGVSVVAEKVVKTRKSNRKDRVVSPITKSSQSIRRKLNCFICRKKFTTRSSLNFHLKDHRWEKQYPCSKCNKSYQKPNDLKRHLVSRHANDPDVRADPSLSLKLQQKKILLKRRRFLSKLYFKDLKLQCPQCPKKFAFPGGLTHHVQTHSSASLYACETCGSKFKSGRRLQAHRHRAICQNVLDRMASRKYECQQCGSWYKNQTHFKKHLRTHHGIYAEKKEQSLTCLFCGYKAITAGILNQHNLTHTGEKPYPCKACGKSFAARPNLYAHIRSNCPAAKKMGLRPELKKSENQILIERNTNSLSRILQCSKCTIAFTRPSDRIKHERTHGDTFHCPLCPSAFNKKRGLAIHKSMAHPGDTDKSSKHICEICEKVFQSYGEHNNHMTDVHQLNYSATHPHNLKCFNCPETFTELEIRDRHEIICAAASIQKAIKNFKCSICVERFCTVQSKRFHEQCHGTAFMCPFCPGGFNNQAKLTLHTRREHSEAVKTSPFSSKCKSPILEDNQSQNVLSSRPKVFQNSQTSLLLISEEIVNHPTDPLADLTSHPRAHADSEISEANVVEISKPFQCSKCVQHFSTLFSKTRHERIHEDPNCPAGFKATKALEQHNYQLHSVKKKTCACNVCGEEFVMKHHLENHLKTHPREDNPIHSLAANSEKQTSSNSIQILYDGVKLDVLNPFDTAPSFFQGPVSMSGPSPQEDPISDWIRSVSNDPLATVFADSESSFPTVILTTVLKMEPHKT